jgi:hypothetical protein
MYIYGERYNGELCKDVPAKHKVTPQKALYSMLKWELGYGGKVKNISETEIVTETQIFACTDTTYFTGTKEEVSLLLKALSVYYQVTKFCQDPVITGVCKTLAGQTTLVVVNYGPILIGTAYAKTTMLATFCETEEDVKKFKDLELEALVPMFELKHENPALSSDELLSLAQ